MAKYQSITSINGAQLEQNPNPNILSYHASSPKGAVEINLLDKLSDCEVNKHGLDIFSSSSLASTPISNKKLKIVRNYEDFSHRIDQLALSKSKSLAVLDQRKQTRAGTSNRQNLRLRRLEIDPECES